MIWFRFFFSVGEILHLQTYSVFVYNSLVTEWEQGLYL